MGPHGELKA